MSAPSTSTYILFSPDVTDLPNARTLLGGSNIALLDTGPTSTLTIQPVGNLGNIAAFNTTGFVGYNATTNLFEPILLQESSTIAITNPDGTGGGPVLSVVPNSSVQQVRVWNNGILSSTRSTLNFIPGANTIITVGDNALTGAADITIDVGENEAPGDATYIIQLPNDDLPNAQPLSLLATGIVKNTTASGVLSIAVSNMDYQAASANLISISAVTPALGSILIGNGAGFSELAIGTPGEALIVGGGGDVAWGTLPGTGTVTSVSLSSPDSSITIGGTNPITVAGTFEISLPNVTSAASYTFANITVDAKGRVTAASSGSPATVTSVAITSPASTLMVTGSPITGSGSINIDLSTTAVTPGDYTNTNLSVDAYGRITAASNGTGVFTTWTNIDPTPVVALAANNGYITTNQAASVTFNLPATASLGDTYNVCCSFNTNNGYTVVATGPQVIRFSTLSGTVLTASGVGNSFSAQLVCIDATVPGSEVFQVVNSTGIQTLA